MTRDAVRIEINQKKRLLDSISPKLSMYKKIKDELEILEKRLENMQK